MNWKNKKKLLKIAFLALLAVALLPAGPSFAVTYNLAAVEAEWTPPDSVIPVSMWGYITDTGSCPGTPVAWDVGPTLVVTAGDNLTINLRNCLAEAVSVFIPGQVKATNPVTFTDGQGRTRVSSFDSVVAPAATGVYTWTSPKTGSYLYQSGTFVAKQVPKGLYGAVVVNVGANEAYAGVTFAQETVLVYSEIDPVLNNAATGAGEGAKVSNYYPKYFLINGETYPNTANINVATGTNVLLRFVNAGLQLYVPTLQGLYMNVIAEDGNLMPYPLNQYQVDLYAAKTKDVIVNVGTEGRYGLYDRALHTAASSNNGGMLTFIQTAALEVPTAADDTYNVGAGNILTVAAPGVLNNDTGTNLTAYRTGTAPPGTLTLNADGSFSYTPTGASGAVETFQYYANNGIVNSSPATVTINVYVSPIAKNDKVSIPRNSIPASIAIADLLANDIAGLYPIDPTSVSLPSANTTRGGTVTVSGANITYTSEGGGGPDYFQYTISDTNPDNPAVSNVATVRINRVRASAVPAAAPAANTPDSRGKIKSR